MNYKVLVSEQAARDLNGIYSYIFHDLKSKLSAERIALRLRDAMIGLSVMPKRYLVKEAESEVWVTRIVYGKRNMKKLLR